MRSFRLVAGSCGIVLLGAVLAACAPQLTDAQHVERARGFVTKKEWRAAMIEYKNALQKNPNHVDARWELGQLYLEFGNGAAAEKEFRRAGELGKPTAAVTAVLARANLAQRRYEPVVAECVKADLAAARDAAGWSACADAWIQKNAVEQAQDAVRRALEIDPQLPAVQRADARVAVATGDMGRAQAIVRKLLERAPDDAESWFLNGDIAFVAGRYSDAALAYEKVLTLDPHDLTTMRGLRARIGLVFALLSQNREDLALPHVEALLKANSKYFLFNYLRGLVAFKRADYPAALEFLQRSVNETRVGSPSMAMLGAVHFALGNLQQADLYLGKYISAVPDDIHARKLLGAVRLRLNQPDKALETLAAGGSISEDVELLRMLGTAASMGGDYGEGREYLRRALAGRSDDGVLRLQIAQTYLAEGDFERGLRELEVAVKSAGTELQARVLTILTLLRKNERDPALNEARRLAVDHAENPVSHNILGGVYLALERRDEARASFQRALQLDPKFTGAMFNLALLEQRAKKYDAARAQLDQVLKIQPNSVQAMIALAQLEESEGRQDKALAWLERARTTDVKAIVPRLLLARFHLRRGNVDSAEALAREVLALQASNPNALSILGDAQVARGRHDEAQKTFETLTRAFPQDASAFVRLGATQMQRAQPALARQSYKRALTLQPDLFPAVAALAALDVREGRADEALRSVDQYRKRNPNVAGGLVLRGDVQAAQGKYDGAIESYAAAAQMHNTVALAVKHALALLQAGRGVAAAEPLRRWLAEHPQDEFAQLNLADIYRRLGRHDEAARQYQAMLQTRPDNPAVLNNLALTYLDAGDARARSVAEQAYKLLPDHPHVADTHAWVLLHSGDVKRAVVLFTDLSQRQPNNPDILTHYALALEKSGDRAGARTVVTDVLKKYPRFESRPQAEALGQRLR